MFSHSSLGLFQLSKKAGYLEGTQCLQDKISSIYCTSLLTKSNVCRMNILQLYLCCHLESSKLNYAIDLVVCGRIIIQFYSFTLNFISQSFNTCNFLFKGFFVFIITNQGFPQGVRGRGMAPSFGRQCKMIKVMTFWNSLISTKELYSAAS